MKKVAVLTGGGDCPGLNAVIRAIVRRANQLAFEVMGVRGGWRGILKRDQSKLTVQSVSGILPRGGTILGTSRTNPYKTPETRERLLSNIKALGIDAIIAIGGEDTLGVARRLSDDGIPVVGVPKTIDNDLAGTDLTFGFDTAVTIATEAIDRLHSTAEAHDRVIVVEVMGRHAGWIAVHAGIAGGADVVLIPERPFRIDEVCDHIRHRHRVRRRQFSIVVVAEGAKVATESGAEEVVTTSQEVDAFGHVRLGGIGNFLGQEIEKRTGFETRVTVLGHVQRGGSPTAFDRVLATRYGVYATELVDRGEYGRMVALRGSAVVSVPLGEATEALRTVDAETYRVAEVFFG